MKISIVVPVYNVEKYISDCIESVLNQSYDNYELILINDGSKDSSGKICDEYAQKHSNITVIHQENRGVAKSWSIGIDIAQGDYIIGLDSDDFWDKDLLERCVNMIKQYNADMVVFGYKNYYTDTKEVKNNQLIVQSGVYSGKDKDIILDSCINRGCFENRTALYLSRINKLIKVDLVKSNEKYCKESFFYGEDNLYAIPNILDAESIVVLADYFPYNYRINPTSITHKYHENLWSQFIELNKLTISILMDKGYDHLIKQVYNDSVFHCAISINNLFKGNLKSKECIKSIKMIINHEMVRKGLKNMNLQLMSYKEKVMVYLMRLKMYRTIYFIKKLVK